MNIPTGKWSRLDIPELPPARIGGALILNPQNNAVLLFGGVNMSVGSLQDLWLTNGLQWEQKQSSLSPGARYGMSMVWDDARHAAVLFGGLESGKLFGDTWLFNGIEWQQKQPLTTPTPRVHANLVYDAIRNLSILFGGLADKGYKYLDALNEMWAWNGENWQQLFPVNLPSARFGSCMVYDKAHDSILLFGGGSGGGFLNDTWIWNGNNWEEQQPLHHPTSRTDFGMAYHEVKKQIVVFGGQSRNGLATGTWIWDGQDWAMLEITQSPPPEMAYSARLAYFPYYQAVVLYNTFREKTIISEESFTIKEHSEYWILDY